MSKEDDIRLDQKVRAAWMYYIAGQNQSEIASQLGTSRPVKLQLTRKEQKLASFTNHGENAVIRRAKLSPRPET